MNILLFTSLTSSMVKSYDDIKSNQPSELSTYKRITFKARLLSCVCQDSATFPGNLSRMLSTDQLHWTESIICFKYHHKVFMPCSPWLSLWIFWWKVKTVSLFSSLHSFVVFTWDIFKRREGFVILFVKF